jgi:hypothetical protein
MRKIMALIDREKMVQLGFLETIRRPYQENLT